MDERLQQLGDALEQAVARNIDGAERHERGVPHTPEVPVSPSSFPLPSSPSSTRPRRSRRLVAGVVVGGIVALGGAAAATVSMLGTDTVARGMPGGSVIFEGTNPSCTTEDHVVFDCTLASVPTAEPYTLGAAELFVDDQSRIAGGCRGLDAAGLRWTCFVGQRAVDEQILAADLLGQVSGPTRG